MDDAEETGGAAGGGAERAGARAPSGGGVAALRGRSPRHVVIVVAVPEDQAEEIAETTGVSVGRIEDEDIERLVLGLFAEGADPGTDEPAYALALAPAIPEERDHLATLARAAEASIVVLEVPTGDQRAVRMLGPRALDEVREFARQAGIEGA